MFTYVHIYLYNKAMQSFVFLFIRIYRTCRSTYKAYFYANIQICKQAYIVIYICIYMYEYSYKQTKI